MTQPDDDHGGKDDAKKHLAEALKRKLETAGKSHAGAAGKSTKDTGKMSSLTGSKGRNFRHQGR